MKLATTKGEITIELFENEAPQTVANFLTLVKQGFYNGSPFHRVLRISDFYTKQDGQWIQNGSDTGLHQESVEEQLATPRPLGEQMKKRLLDAREAVWRA